MSYITLGGKCVSNKLAGIVSVLVIVSMLSGAALAVDDRFEKEVNAKKTYRVLNAKIDNIEKTLKKEIDTGNLETQKSVNNLAKIVINSMIANAERRKDSYAKNAELDRLNKDYIEHDRESQRINNKLDGIK